MRIKKTSQYIEDGASISNVYGTSQSNGYSQEYINSINTYSTDETICGTWGGKPLYRKVVNFGTMPNATAQQMQHGISNIAKIVYIGGYWERDNSFGTLPNVNPNNASASINVSATLTTIWIETGTNRTDCTATIILEYTKTTD